MLELRSKPSGLLLVPPLGLVKKLCACSIRVFLFLLIYVGQLRGFLGLGSRCAFWKAGKLASKRLFFVVVATVYSFPNGLESSGKVGFFLESLAS